MNIKWRQLRNPRLLFAAIGLAFAIGSGMPAFAQSTPPSHGPEIDKALEGAQPAGRGLVSAYTKAGSTLLVLPATAFERLFLWYAEVVSVPTNVVNFLDLGTAVVRFERRGNIVFVRDLSGGFVKRAGRQDPRPGQEQGARISPIDISVRRGNEAPIMAEIPILAAASDGAVLIDITKVFSGDIETLSAMPQVVKAGLIPAAVNPLRSYLTSIRVFPQNFGVRTHLTFMAKDPKDAAAPLRGVSMRIGHSIIQLPEQPMAARDFDPRIGFFYSRYTEYESGAAAERVRSMIHRFRLEKKDPSARVSDPVKPITFYISREVPARWRPYIRAGVELWRPVFEAAGFSNAIVAVDAPSFDQDPNWTEEDARYSTIRWLAEPMANARGPQIVDPRSGEIVSSHVEVWPQVLNYFGRYYFALNSALDPKANTLPLSEEVQGRLLAYIVGHEVGHAIGLRHNHLASTPFSTAQMRDPAFANKWGANSSIMAYGRFNQAAQPGDGVTKTIPGIGPYDYFAIVWGYGLHGKTADEERKALDAMAAKAQGDRALRWAAGEMPPDEIETWILDPRIQKENTGADRLEATRLGVANVLRALQKLDKAVAGNAAEYTAAHSQMMAHHAALLTSVASLLGGVEVDPNAAAGATAVAIPADRQRAAVRYLLGDGARSLDAYAVPAIAVRAHPGGTPATVEAAQAALLATLFDGPKLLGLEQQKAADPKAYGVIDFARDSYEAVWGDLSAAPPWRRALQRAYLARIAKLLKAETDDPSAREAQVKAGIGAGFSQAFSLMQTATGAETALPGWARETLPRLAQRLEAAANTAKSAEDRYHFRGMAALARNIVGLGR